MEQTLYCGVGVRILSEAHGTLALGNMRLELNFTAFNIKIAKYVIVFSKLMLDIPNMYEKDALLTLFDTLL